MNQNPLIDSPPQNRMKKVTDIWAAFICATYLFVTFLIFKIFAIFHDINAIMSQNKILFINVTMVISQYALLELDWKHFCTQNIILLPIVIICISIMHGLIYAMSAHPKCILAIIVGSIISLPILAAPFFYKLYPNWFYILVIISIFSLFYFYKLYNGKSYALVVKSLKTTSKLIKAMKFSYIILAIMAFVTFIIFMRILIKMLKIINLISHEGVWQTARIILELESLACTTFIFVFQQFIVAKYVNSVYFGGRKENILILMGQVFRYHIGSVCLGKMMLVLGALMNIIRHFMSVVFGSFDITGNQIVSIHTCDSFFISAKYYMSLLVTKEQLAPLVLMRKSVVNDAIAQCRAIFISIGILLVITFSFITSKILFCLGENSHVAHLTISIYCFGLVLSFVSPLIAAYDCIITCISIDIRDNGGETSSELEYLGEFKEIIHEQIDPQRSIC